MRARTHTHTHTHTHTPCMCTYIPTYSQTHKGHLCMCTHTCSEDDQVMLVCDHKLYHWNRLVNEEREVAICRLEGQSIQYTSMHMIKSQLSTLQQIDCACTHTYSHPLAAELAPSPSPRSSPAHKCKCRTKTHVCPQTYVCTHTYRQTHTPLYSKNVPSAGVATTIMLSSAVCGHEH